MEPTPSKKVSCAPSQDVLYLIAMWGPLLQSPALASPGNGLQGTVTNPSGSLGDKRAGKTTSRFHVQVAPALVSRNK